MSDLALKVCPVCLEKVSLDKVVFFQCGHKSCLVCYRRLPLKSEGRFNARFCAECRAKIQEPPLRIYLSSDDIVITEPEPENKIVQENNGHESATAKALVRAIEGLDRIATPFGRLEEIKAENDYLRRRLKELEFSNQTYRREKANKGTSRVILAVLSIFLLFTAAPLSVIRLQCPQAVRSKHRIHSGHWDKPLGARCLGFGTREYTARLWNLPFFSDWMAACEETEIEIRGALIPRPSYCESRWPMGGVIGHWVTNFEEEQCLAHWGSFSDKGCVKKDSKIRRFQSRLWDVKSGEDWMSLCSTAPAVVNGIQIPKPSFCDDRGIWGIYGIWDIDDQNC